MRKLLLSSFLLATLVAFACNPFKKKDDGGDAASDASVAAEAEAPPPVVEAGPPAPTITAKNVSDVARFPGETAITDDEAKLAQVVQVRTAPKGGSLVATLSPGADVTKFAEYQGSYLVQFPDPKDANTTLLGWIVSSAFVAPTVIKPKDAGAVVTLTDAGGQEVIKKIACPGGFTAVILTKDPVCKKKCTKDSDCKTGGCQNANGQGGGVVRACSSD